MVIEQYRLFLTTVCVRVLHRDQEGRLVMIDPTSQDYCVVPSEETIQTFMGFRFWLTDWKDVPRYLWDALKDRSHAPN